MSARIAVFKRTRVLYEDSRQYDDSQKVTTVPGKSSITILHVQDQTKSWKKGVGKVYQAERRTHTTCGGGQAVSCATSIFAQRVGENAINTSKSDWKERCIDVESYML